MTGPCRGTTCSPTNTIRAKRSCVQQLRCRHVLHRRHGHDPAYNTTTKRFTFHLLRRAAFKITADATPEPIREGAYLTVRGTLTLADGDQDCYVGYGGQWSQVQFSVRGSVRWTTVKTVTAKDGFYRLHYAGSGVAGSATSGGDCVDVC